MADIKASALPPDAAPSTDDLMITVDNASGATKRITLAQLATLISANITDSAIGHADVAAGMVVQCDQTDLTAVQTLTGTIPFDDTIPQITEGTEVGTLVFTPKSSTNKLIIEAMIWTSPNVANANPTVAIFQDAVSNALGAGTQFQLTNTGRSQVYASCEITAGTTSAITFRVRVGNDGAATITINGNSGGRIYGATPKSWIRVTEYKA